MIQLKNIDYRYSNRNHAIIDNLTMEINQGDVVLIEGGNGSGKTTLLRILAGIAPKFTGGILSGQRIFQNQTYDDINIEKFGMLFHGNDQQFIQSQVDQEILYVLETQGYEHSIIQQKFDSLVEDFNLTHLLDREILTLSSGEAQLLKLALAFVFRPQVILLDEPLSHLDHSWQTTTINTLVELRKKYQLTYIIAEHHLEPWKIFGDSVRHISLSEKKTSLPVVTNVQKVKSNVPLMEFKNLKLSYDNQVVFSDFNHKINEGECVVISGSNGSGKTSLLNLIMGHIPPTDGEIIEFSECKKSFLTNPTIENFFSQKVSDELKLNDEFKSENSVFDLSSMMDDYVFDLSQGEQRKVALSLLNQSSLKLILLDEPFLHLDEKSTQQLLEFIQQLKVSKITTIITTHHSGMLQELADQEWNLSGLK